MLRLSVENHRLVGDHVEHLENVVGSIIKPEVVVIHYAVTDSLDSLVRSQRATQYWAHLCIDGWHGGNHDPTYKIVQSLAFNQRGSHAGTSSWKGRSKVSDFSIGIEISNPGPLIRGADGQLRTTYGKVWKETEAVEARHKFPGTPKQWTHWAKFTEQEFEICREVCRALTKCYGSLAVVGHDDIAPGRKSDPGPAFPMERLLQSIT